MATVSQWYFTADEVHSTPSIVDGIAPEEERLRRAKGVNFIYQAGVMLDLPQITLWVAGVFFHRFYMRCSMVQEKGGIHHYVSLSAISPGYREFGTSAPAQLLHSESAADPLPRQNIAATALFLANKVEENCRKTKDIIVAVAKVAQKNAKLVIDEQSKEYWRWRDSILTYEETMLEQLTFDLMVDNPYRHLFELLGQLGIVHNKHLRQSAWAFCNDACVTALPLLIEARDVAISSIFFASVHTNQQIDDIDGDSWWRFLNGDEERCTKAIEVMRQFYTENPLRKQNPSLPSPAFDLENTRRRADTLLSQPETLSSTGGTPVDVDRASRSPIPRTNGGTDKGPGARDRALEPGSQPGPNGSDYAPRSPSKRKDAEIDSSAEHERAEKRARLSEDEGELVED